MTAAKILIVDDEASIVEALVYRLKQEGFRPLTAGNGARALELARRELPDVVVLDWMLPEIDGLEVCRRLKQDEATKRIAVVMLTVKSDETDKVLGLEMGADDYVTKPFGVRELVARIKAVLRRADGSSTDEIFQVGDLRIEWQKHVVLLKGKPIELTSKEFELLRALIQAKGRVLSREQLLDRVWSYDRSIEIETRTVDLHISQLRKKLKHLADHIVTVKNAGYRFDSDRP